MIPQQDLERIAILLFREYREGLSGEETAELEKWRSVYPQQVERARQLLSQNRLPELLKRLELADTEIRKKLAEASVPVELKAGGSKGQAALYHGISPADQKHASPDAYSHPHSSKKIFSVAWFRYAAVVALLLSLGVVFLRKTGSRPDGYEQAGIKSRVQPDAIVGGSNKAVLILADGRKITLDSTGNGQVAMQNDVRIVKVSGGALKYEETGSGSSLQGNMPVAMNTIETPKAGQYSLILPDGSKVWLNAASSLTFPAKFDRGARRISMSGEAYFEVVQDMNRPFMVNVNGSATVEVLGTHFNINAYADEPAIKTTLLEGKVKVVKDKEERLLLPGEQAAIRDHIQFYRHVDTGQVMAWKNGLFNFDGADTKTLMRQLERWYDIKVNYQDPVPEIRFKGKMYRNENLASVLQFLSEYGLQFKTEGKTVTVSGKRRKKE
jgi:ferric-dicitrate binding protein FerR (iron transport regulator)